MDRVKLNFRIVFTIVLGLWGLAKIESMENTIDLIEVLLYLIAAYLLFAHGFTEEELD